MNHEVRTRCQLCWLFPHEAVWEKEATCWQSPNRQKMLIGNMAEAGLWWNGGQGLHVRLVGMPMISFVFQKSHCIFFPGLFLLWCKMPQVPLHLKHGALCIKYVSLGIERQFFKMIHAWCGSISLRLLVMLSSTSVFAFKCSGGESWNRGNPSNCQWLRSGIERDGNSSWKVVLVWCLCG